MKIVKNCEVCFENNITEVLNLGNHPLCDDLIKIGDDRTCEEYPIIINYCSTCHTAHQDFQVNKEKLFTNDYHYRARMTGSVLSGMRDLVQACELKYGKLKNKKVLDIGCNDGSLLDFFAEKECATFGIDPTSAVKESKHDSIKGFFDENTAKQILEQFGSPDIITFTNVFAHIENLPKLLSNLSILINANTLVVIENHYLGAVLMSNQFDTFYHEHPRTYSLKSFEYISKSLGLRLQDAQFVSRYGGNIRVFLSNNNLKNKSSESFPNENSFLDDFKEMQSHVDEWIKNQSAFLNDFVKLNGKLIAKAFPGRAAILIKLLGLNENHISAVYEITGSIKVNHFVPGTKIPILPEADLYNMKDQNQPILNLAWHIPNEVRANLIKNNYTGQVIDIKTLDTNKIKS